VRAYNTGAKPPFGSARHTHKSPMTQITVHKPPLPDLKEF